MIREAMGDLDCLTSDFRVDLAKSLLGGPYVTYLAQHMSRYRHICNVVWRTVQLFQTLRM